MRKSALCGLLLLSFGSYAGTDMLPDWNDTPAKQAIKTWVENSTKEGGPDFIPVSQRYVIFDNDGTLWPEAPLTFQLQFAVDEVKRLAPEHPEWKRDPVVHAVLNNDIKSVASSGEKGLLELVSLTHSGMSSDEFSLRVNNWLNQHQDKRTGCRYDQMGYLPMRQLLNYLRENGFKTWIVSGGGIDFMRIMSERMYGIPPEQVIGSFSLSQFDMKGKNVHLQKSMKGTFNNDAANKPTAIHLFMGHHPVAAFGNSDGDLQMLQYTAANSAYKTFNMLLHHTDAAREYAYDAHPPASGKLSTALSEAKSRGWTIVDMKQDWATVFDPTQCPAARQFSSAVHF